MAAKYADERLPLPAIYAPGKIGVVTVLYNSATVLADFFTSLEAQQYPDFTVYCVDNGSTDDSVAQCRARGGRYLIIENGSNLGVPAGNNVGTRAAIKDGCEFVLYLNNDVVFGPELFEQLVKGLKQQRCSMTAPIMHYHNRPDVIWAAGGSFQPWMGYRPQHYGDGDVDHGQYNSLGRVDYTPTCCVLVSRHLFSTIGLMDERYFVYYDDTDFMLRAYLMNEALYLLPHARLWHKVSSLVGTSSPFRTRYVYRNHGLYIHKHLSWPRAYITSFIYWTIYLALGLLRRLSFSEALLRIRYWRDGIRVASTSGPPPQA